MTDSADLPFDDTQDFEDARRGLIAALEPCVVHGPDGRVIWDNDAYDFLTGDCPDTAHPSLWRQSQLNSIQGLFEVDRGHLPGAGPRPVEHDDHRGRRRASSSSTRWSRPRPRRRRSRSTGSTGATGRSRPSSTPTATSTTSAG